MLNRSEHYQTVLAPSGINVLAPSGGYGGGYLDTATTTITTFWPLTSSAMILYEPNRTAPTEGVGTDRLFGL